MPTALGNDDAADAQNIGVVFGHEFEQQFTVSRDFSGSATDPADSADFYKFQVIQSLNYSFFIRNANGTVSSPDLVDASGNVLVTGGEGILNVHLNPGTYYLRVDGWNPRTARGTTYDLVFSLGTNNENPTPLTSGPAPALRLQLVGTVAPPSPVPPVITLPVPPGIQNVTPTGGDGGANSGLAGLLPGVANALAAGPLGGVRGPDTGYANGPTVVFLDLNPPTFLVGDAGVGRVPAPGTDGGDDTGDNFFSQFAVAVYKFSQRSVQVKDLLFSHNVAFNGPITGASEEQDPPPVPEDPEEDPSAGPVDEAQLAAPGRCRPRSVRRNGTGPGERPDLGFGTRLYRPGLTKWPA